MTNNKLKGKVHPVLLDSFDRRYCCIENSLDLVGNRDFFNTFYKNIINNKKIIRHFYEELNTRDLSEFELRNIPRTKLKNEIIKMSRSPYMSALEENYEDYAGRFVSSNELLERVKQYGRQNNIGVGYMNSTKMGREYTKLTDIMKQSKIDDTRGYKFESLKILRKYFDFE